jgi:hypothetical protein
MEEKTITLNERKYTLRNDKRAEFRRSSRTDDFRKADGFAIICLHIWAMIDLPTKRLPEPEEIASWFPDDEDEAAAISNDVLYVLTDGKMGGGDDDAEVKEAKKKRSKSGRSSASQSASQDTNT